MKRHVWKPVALFSLLLTMFVGCRFHEMGALEQHQWVAATSGDVGALQQAQRSTQERERDEEASRAMDARLEEARFWEQSRLDFERQQARIEDAKSLVEQGDYEQAIEGLDRLLDSTRGDKNAPLQAGTALSMKFKILLGEVKDSDRAYALGREALEGGWKWTGWTDYLGLASAVLDDSVESELRDFDFALDATRLALQHLPSPKPSSPSYDDMVKYRVKSFALLAEFHARRGEFPEAAEMQQKAIDLLPETGTGNHLAYLLANQEAYQENALPDQELLLEQRRKFGYWR